MIDVPHCILHHCGRLTGAGRQNVCHKAVSHFDADLGLMMMTSCTNPTWRYLAALPCCAHNNTINNACQYSDLQPSTPYASNLICQNWIQTLLFCLISDNKPWTNTTIDNMLHFLQISSNLQSQLTAETQSLTTKVTWLWTLCWLFLNGRK